MNLKTISNEELVGRLKKLAATERKITRLVLEHINEIHQRQYYLELGYGSLFTYLVEELKYSEASAYRRLLAAELLREVPEVASKLEAGNINLSQATEVQKRRKNRKKQGAPVSQQESLDILGKLENKTAFESARILGQQFSEFAETKEFSKPQSDGSVRLELTMTEEQYKSLTIARDLLSHVFPEGRFSDVIARLAMKFNDSKLGKIWQEEQSHRNSASG